jgi:hypothetical protein
MRLFALALLLLPIAVPAQVAPAGDVVIYRCTDRAGRLTLRDTPCDKHQTQQTLTMVRPKDRPQAPIARRAPEPAVSPAPPRVVVVHEPRPLYECVPPDGEPYTSDSPEGHPRWVPLWTLDIPYEEMTVGPTHIVTSGGNRPHPRRGLGLGAYGAGTWIRDTCYALPQADVCARLVDRRDAIRRRFFNAMPSERDTLNVEERSVNARLDADCGAY